MAKQRVQKRISAIPTTDVVGECRITAEDKARTLAQLRSHCAELVDFETGEHGRRISKITYDSDLSRFASTVDMVQHTIDLQRAMKQRHSSVPDERRTRLRV